MNDRSVFRKRLLRVGVSTVAIALGGLVLVPSALPQEGTALFKSLEKAGVAGPLDPSLYAGQCNYSNIPGIVWWGTETEMTVERIASLAAPIYWFSPDEPLLRGTEVSGSASRTTASRTSTS